MARDPEFGASWDRLYDACPWSTSMQSRVFVETWYSIYRERFEPLLVAGKNADGKLTGLLPLALEPGSRRLHLAGAHQAEYQAWLAPANDGSEFIEAALLHLRQQFPSGWLRFLFLPAGAPLDWLAPGRPLASYCDWRMVQRPLMDTRDVAGIQESLRKKRYRSRIQWFEKLGPLRFQRLESLEELDRYLDQIILLYDFRQGAAYGALPFQQDPLKRPFYRAMMATGRLIHATVLTVNEQVVSAQLNLLNGDQVTLGVVAHSPFFSQQSPGRLHLFYLGLQMNSQGLSALDLTPGADYKDRFATHHDEVAVVTVFFSRVQSLKREAEKWAKGVGKKLGLDRVRARLRSKTQAPAPVRTFQVADTGDLPVGLSRNELRHLLGYRPGPGGQPLVEFLREAMERLERNESFYTYMEGEQLTFSAWHREQPGETRIHGIYSCSGRTGELLRQVIGAAAVRSAGARILVSVPEPDAPLLRAVESMGAAELRS
jgi:CelD/BcsL family acetyltransferase involved in cellulose biosynthesis